MGINETPRHISSGWTIKSPSLFISFSTYFSNPTHLGRVPVVAVEVVVAVMVALSKSMALLMMVRE